MQRYQYVVPQLLITKIFGVLGKSPLVGPLFIKVFCKLFTINMEESALSLSEFKTFNAFFTRLLKPGTRPIATAGLVSPADGTLSECGPIHNGQLIQAKGKYYSQDVFLAGLKADYHSFATIYLAPHNYHNVHAPCDFTVQRVRYVPGKLFSVSIKTAQKIPNIFAINERLILEGFTPFGKMSYVMVGAMCVAGIETVITGNIARSKNIQDFDCNHFFAKGDRIGSFYMGSTVIMLVESPLAFTRARGEILMGQGLI